MSKRDIVQTGLNCSLVLLVLLMLFMIGRKGEGARILPPSPGDRVSIPVVTVPTQKDVYAVLRSSGTHGSHLVHLNQHFNLEDYFPLKEATSVPFPIVTYDIRPSYEEGLNSHNWLFIANRTGLVRRVTSVLPESSFRERSQYLAADFSFSFREGGFYGYSYDMPRDVVPPQALSSIAEPVIVALDAGFFRDGIRPEEVVRLLREKCPDIRGIVLVESLDEEGVTPAMRVNLSEFASQWRNST